MAMQRCSQCNEPIVRMSKVPGVCLCCYQVLDMGRYEEVDPVVPNSWKCDRCKDWGKILMRKEPGNPSFLIAIPCPNCGGKNVL
jgi:hypothetical protein